MNLLFNNKQRWYLNYISIIAIMVCYFTTSAGLNISIIFLFALAVINVDFKKNIYRLWQDKGMLAIGGILGLYLLGGFHSTDQGYFFKRASQKIPMLMLAYSFAAMYFFKRKHYHQMFYIFIGICTLLSIGVLVDFAINYGTYIQLEGHSRYVPTPINHIRFSLALAFACSAAFYFFLQKHTKWVIKYILLGISIYLFAFLHFFSVRSGLLAIYLTAIGWVVYYVIQSKKIVFTLAMLLSLVVLPLVAYQTVKPLKTRIDFMVFDIKSFKNNPDLYNYSDGKRIGSIIAACSAYQQNYLVGYGFGDIFEGMDKGYDKVLPHILPNSRIIPHNQFLVVAVGLGTLGTLLFLYLLYVTLVFKKRYLHPLVWSFAIIMISSFLSEPTLEAQRGVALYCLTGLLSLSYAQAAIDENIGSNN